MENLGEKIKELRKQKGVSQEELAFKLGVSRQTINKWEGNVVQPGLENIAVLCKFFGIKSDYFFDDGQAEQEVAAAEAATAEVQPKGKNIPFIVSLVLLIVCSVLFVVFMILTISSGLNAFSNNVGYDRISTAETRHKSIFTGYLIASIILLCADVVLAFLVKKFKK
ncbi:MAG: helix-turn-helix domain-containing protein [Clostridia bacterium]|nr:helix-turn-helix domain-containing protein [Clostridia bacterium]